MEKVIQKGSFVFELKWLFTSISEQRL